MGRAHGSDRGHGRHAAEAGRLGRMHAPAKAHAAFGRGRTKPVAAKAHAAFRRMKPAAAKTAAAETAVKAAAAKAPKA